MSERYERKTYRPERLPQAAERSLGEGGLRAALDVARRIHETGEATLFTEPQTKDERWEINQTLRIREYEALRSYANSQQLWLDGNEFTRLWVDQGEIEGGEHQVIYFHSRVFKRNNLYYHSNWLEYFHRLVLHNWLFPETMIRFEGLMMVEDELQPVISQKAFLAIRGASRREVEKEMQRRGFVRRFADNYYNPDMGISVEDLHDENVLVSPAGSLLIFDPVIYLTTSEKKM